MRASPNRCALPQHRNTASRTTRRVATRLVAAWRVALIGFIISCLSLGLAALATPVQSPPEIQLPDNPLRGRALYESKRCVQCHGLAGSEASIGPILGEGRFDGTFLELGAALWNHVPGMTVTFDVSGLEWPQLSARQATELVAFLYFIDYLGRPGDAAAGRAVFEREACSSCHAIGGGEANTASAGHSTVGGGLGNSIGTNGDFGAIPGGRDNEVNGEYAFAAGRKAPAICFANPASASSGRSRK